VLRDIVAVTFAQHSGPWKSVIRLKRAATGDNRNDYEFRLL
jgi:hypothetical protein